MIPDNPNAKPCLALSLVEERPAINLLRQYRVRGDDAPKDPLAVSGAEALLLTLVVLFVSTFLHSFVRKFAASILSSIELEANFQKESKICESMCIVSWHAKINITLS